MSMNSVNPIIQKFLEIERSLETGVLELSSGSRRISITFRHGAIQAATSNIDEWRLGRYLLSSLDVDQLHRLLADSRKIGVPLGECAVRAGLIDKNEVLESVGNQISDLLVLALGDGFKIRSFSNEASTFELSPQLSCDRLLLHVARRDGGTYLVPSGHRIFLDPERDLSHFDWYPQELAVLSQLRRFPPTLDDLLAETGVHARMACKILRVLDLLGLIEVHEANENQSTALVRRSRFPLELLVPKVAHPEFHPKLEVALRPQSFATEQFKSLKILIRDSGRESIKVLSVTSPHEQDGKSLVSANLSLAFADDPERRVVVIDCDIRRPSLHQYFRISNEPGLLNFLQSDNHLPPHCFMRRIGALYVMASGGVSDTPVEMLSMNKMRELFEYLRSEFDTIIIDCPPCQPMADAQIVTRLADASVLIIRRGQTPYSSIERSLKALEAGKLLGVVFNDVKPELFHTYYNYGYYYGKDSGYRYSSSQPKRKKKRRRTYLDAN